jgi:phosphoserine aminotransferase
MFHRTFNPGPSQISDAVKADIATASEQNIIAVSHRSDVFADITREAIVGLRQYFQVPEDYQILFAPSATEAMELIIRNLVARESFHFTNGHFSELFARVSKSFGKTTAIDAAMWGEQNDHAAAVVPKSADIIALTYNETSTGAICPPEIVSNLRQRWADQLLVVDITSVAGCIPIGISAADVWFFSVQKGMGLPSGLGVLFLSPRAMERSKLLRHAGLFNFGHMAEKMAQHQTLHTPNVLGIYLLAKQLGRWNQPGASDNYKETRAKAKLLDQFISNHAALSYFVKDKRYRSPTSVCLTAESKVIERLDTAAKAHQLVLGAGYGKLEAETCRIATFPALSQDDIKLLISALDSALS